MSNLTRPDGFTQWTGSYNQTNLSKKYTFATKNKINDRDIEFTVTSNAMNIPKSKSYQLIFPDSTGVPTFNFAVDASGNITVS